MSASSVSAAPAGSIGRTMVMFYLPAIAGNDGARWRGYLGVRNRFFSITRPNGPTRNQSLAFAHSPPYAEPADASETSAPELAARLRQRRAAHELYGSRRGT